MSLIDEHIDDQWEVCSGWRVMAAGGEPVGTVEGVHPRHLIVSGGPPAYDTLFVPVDAVADVEIGRIYLRVPIVDLPRLAWELIPATDVAYPVTEVS